VMSKRGTSFILMADLKQKRRCYEFILVAYPSTFLAYISPEGNLAIL